jgi:hypothetical protein
MVLLASSLAEWFHIVVALVGLALGDCFSGRSSFCDHVAHSALGELD